MAGYPHGGGTGRGLAPSCTISGKPTAGMTMDNRKEKNRMGDYPTFFPAPGPGVHSKTSVILRISRPFAGSFSFLALIIAFTFS